MLSLDQITVVIPCARTGNKEWLTQARHSFPRGTKIIVAWNDGEVTEALNAGWRDAKTKWVYFFGADDVALPGLLENLLGWSWNADVVYPSMIFTNETMSKQLGVFDAEMYNEHRLLHSNYITGSSLIRRKMLKKVGGFRDLAHMEDWDLMLRIQKVGGRFKACPQAAFYYRQVEGSRNKTVKVTLDEIRQEFGVADRPPVLATFYNQATPATTYNRCILPARYLPGAVRGNPVAQTVALVDDPQTAEDVEVIFPEHEGAAILQFAADQHRAGVNLYMKEVLGVRTLLETDDNYLSMHDASIRGRAGWAQNLGDAHSTTEGHRVIVRDVDGVIVTCEALARTYRKINPNVFVCPNGVDPKDWPEPVKPDDGIFRIGLSGGRSHVGDMKLVLKALEWASAQKDVRVVIQGVGSDGLRFPHERMRWDDDLDAYRTRWQYYDAIVCPIIPNPWSICRSDLKALEGAMGGCALILSDVEPFSAWDDTNCLKASSSKDFLNHVKHLVANRDEVKQLASAAREYVLEKRTTQAQIHLWRDALVED